LLLEKPVGPFQAIDELTVLASASDPREAIDALERARLALGEQADAFAPLLEMLVNRARDLHRFRQMASSDDLTGVANRRSFRETLHRELARHKRNRSGLALLLLDVDNLKTINDEYGHEAGDAAIVATAGACREVLRTSDLLARLGGDEFAILLPETDVLGGQAAASRVRAAVQSRAVHGTPLRVSIGIAAAEGVEDGTTLIAHADASLYRDKRARKAGSQEAA
jgi:diguanylate cyclase (GGDEF)-like protein